MNVDKLFILSLIEGSLENFTNTLLYGAKESLLVEPYSDAFKFLKSHFLKYRSIASRELLCSRVPVNFTGENLSEPTNFYLDQLKVRGKLNMIQGLAKDIINSIHNSSSDEEKEAALELIDKRIMEVSSKLVLEYSDARIVDITDTVDVRYNEFMKFKEDPEAYTKAIKTPWELINEEIFGFIPGDIVMFQAKSGLGKSWALCLCLAYAFGYGHKCLLFTQEMSANSLATRLDSLLTKIPFGALKSGGTRGVDDIKYESYAKQMKQNRVEELIPNFYIAEGMAKRGQEALLSVIAATGAKMVAIDSAYLFPKSPDWKDIYAFTSTMKYAAMANQFVCLMSNQESKNSNTGGAFGPSFFNEASLYFRLVQDPLREVLPFMGFEILKGRDLTKENRQFMTNWCFETMNFSYRPDIPFSLGDIDVA